MIKVWVISYGCPFKILFILMRHGVPVGAVGWVGASATVHMGTALWNWFSLPPLCSFQGLRSQDPSSKCFTSRALFLYCETRSLYVAQAGLELMELLLLPPRQYLVYF